MGDDRHQGSKEEDIAALHALHDATGGRNWVFKWDLEADPKMWYGVGINDDGRVISLKLENNNLQGKRPFSYSGSRFTQIVFVRRGTQILDLVETTTCSMSEQSCGW